MQAESSADWRFNPSQFSVAFQHLISLVICDKMNREELEEVFNRVYIGQFKKNEKRKVDGSKTLDRNYFSRFRRVRKSSLYEFRHKPELGDLI